MNQIWIDASQPAEMWRNPEGELVLAFGHVTITLGLPEERLPRLLEAIRYFAAPTQDEKFQMALTSQGRSF